jgi:CO dehydrogenase maturation factor
MRLAIAGKGGSGKTTIAGTLARLLGRAGRDVIAVDADTNPNLAATLGIENDRAQQIVALPRTLLTRETQPDGTVRSTFARDPLDVLREYGAEGPDRVRLVVMGAVGHGGAG